MWPQDESAPATAFIEPQDRLLEPLQEDLGPGFHYRTTPHFLIAYNTDDPWAQERGAVLDLTHQRFYEAFRAAGFAPREVPDKLVCVMFELPRQFERYALIADQMNLAWSRGYYSARTNRVAFFDERGEPDAPRGSMDPTDDDRSTLMAATPNGSESDAAALNLAKTTHEAAHQLAFNCGLQTRGVMYPLWVSEGLATCFELEDPNGRFGPEYDNPLRHRHLAEALRQGETLDLLEMAGLAKAPTHSPERLSVIYAQSWAMFKFLFERRPEQLRAYLQTLSELPAGARASETLQLEFLTAFGPLSDLQREWSDFLEAFRGAE
jgi:hypothetical protein